ncbi:MAG: hypothetical protein GX121_05665 [Ignavibacteria bacterium]|nr:hypothetical protein [Ignavibacteria bacterium]
MKIKIVLQIFSLLLLLLAQRAFPQHCNEEVIWDGSEKVLNYGIDTTGNWWFITQPFTKQYRLIVNGEQSEVALKIDGLTFSNDGTKWAAFSKEKERLYLFTNEGKITLPSLSMSGTLKYTPNSEKLVYSYKHENIETIVVGEKKFQIMNGTGDYYLSYGGERVALLGRLSSGYVMNINGVESPIYDALKPLGFWSDGQFVYAGKSGTTWQIYKGNKSISDRFKDVSEVAINIYGTVAAALVTLPNNSKSSIIISDEYYEPLMGRQYDQAYDLVLHPELAMIGYRALDNGKNIVVLNSVEYAGGEYSGKPRFTYDGSELYFLGCNNDCFLNVNGKNYPILSDLTLSSYYAKKPNSETLAYSTSSAMIVRNLQFGTLYAGKMVDEISDPIYNRKLKRYEAIGRISDKLYLIHCTF